MTPAPRIVWRHLTAGIRYGVVVLPGVETPAYRVERHDDAWVLVGPCGAELARGTLAEVQDAARRDLAGRWAA